MAYNGRGDVMAIDKLPKDSAMLLSFVNTRLRDDGIGLDDFCSQFGISREELQNKLSAIGYEYNVVQNKFL